MMGKRSLRAVVAATLLAFVSPPALAEEAEGCERIAMAAGWTIFAGFGPDVTPEEVVEETTATASPDFCTGLVWSDEQVLDMIHQIIESDFEIDRTDRGMRRSGLFGRYFGLQCATEVSGIRFHRLPEVKSVIEDCIQNSSQTQQAYDFCLLDGTIIEDSLENYVPPARVPEETEVS